MVHIHARDSNGLAVVADDGVRVGLEDNIWYNEERKRLATNALLVEQVIKIAGAS